MPFSRSRSPESMHAVDDGLVRAEGAGLAEHRVDERGLAVVDMGDDRDVAQVVRGSRSAWATVGRESSRSWDGASCRTSASASAPRRAPASIGADDRRRRDPVRDRPRARSPTRSASRASDGWSTWPGRAARCPIVVVSPDPDGAVAAALAGHRGGLRRRPRRAEAGPRRPDGPRRRAGRGRGPRHDRGPALAGADDLGRARDDHVAHRGARHRTGHDAAAGLARRARLAGPPAARPTSSAPRDRAGPDAARRRRRCSSPTDAPQSRIDRAGRSGRRATTSTTAPSDLPPYEGPPDPPGRPHPRVGRRRRRRGGSAGRPRPEAQASVARATGRPAGTRRGARSSGTVASAIPPITSATPSSCATDGASPSSTIARPTDIDRLDQQDDRGHDRRQPRQRDRDQQVAGRLRR